MWNYVIEFIDDYNDVASVVIIANCQTTAIELFKKVFPHWEIIDIYVVE